MEPALLKNVSIDDKYTVESGRIFVTGIQTLVRLPMLQQQRDAAQGRRTAGYISGYRGSPLGGFDLQLQRAAQYLESHDIRFSPGINEDLAATAVWGTQQSELDGDGLFDGVFAMWYGKGPGVDRSGDALRHANLFGTSAWGGVLALMGDDHTCESSTTSHQSEYAMVDAMIPVLNPAGVQDILDFGLYGWALSRFSGCWVGLKCVHDTVEATASIDISPERVKIKLPEDYQPPADGLNIRRPDTPQAQEKRLHMHKHLAVQAFVRANRLDRTVLDSSDAAIGVLTTGKSYLDVCQALSDLGINEAAAARVGLRVHKVAMSYPLEPEGVKAFCRGLQTVVVVEEKRGLMEEQLKTIMFNQQDAPKVMGKFDLEGTPLFPSTGRLDSNQIALKLGRQILAVSPDQDLEDQVGSLDQRLKQTTENPSLPMLRTPYFCAGCPHNISTKIPPGSKAMAGIGCHYMVQWMDRDTQGFTHMGAEGASWIGQAPFCKTGHLFQNVGDGTYFHSGIMAMRAAIAADVNITFKILYNDAVAMTGGQAVEGQLSPARIAWQTHAEGAKRIAVVAEDPKTITEPLPPGVKLYHRDELDQVQLEFREVKGTSVIIYDQTCAAEKRRRRKRGLYPDPPKRMFIYDRVCEGCGDCGVQSNCVAILPKDTAFGRKREIDQSACNKDFSCNKGFCPSFVTVHGGQVRKGAQNLESLEQMIAELPSPVRPRIDGTYSIVLTGVGGTGVVTIGAILGMAAHISEQGCSVLDMTGLAQKGGAVMSHIILANRPEDISATHIPTQGAELLLACDMVVAAGPGAVSRFRKDRTNALVNDFQMMTGDFTRRPDMPFPKDELLDLIRERTAGIELVNATVVASRLLGDSIGANMFMLGAACQLGWIPLDIRAIEKAIELNGQAVAMNHRALNLGRLYATDRDRVTELAGLNEPQDWDDLDSVVALRVKELTAYQNKRYAKRYEKLVSRVRTAETETAPGREALTRTVAANLYQTMAYKDEYEVARLFSSQDFQEAVAEQFEGDYRLEFNLAPPLLARKDPLSGRPAKKQFGPWMLRLFAGLKRFRFLRHTPFDPFAYGGDRRCERRISQRYRQDVEWVLERLRADNHKRCVEMLAWPETVKGFGPVKRDNLNQAERVREQLRSQILNEVRALSN